MGSGDGSDRFKRKIADNWRCIQYAIQNEVPQECFVLANCHRLVLTNCIRFQAIAQKNGAKHAPIELLHGDFLECDAVKTAMASAGVYRTTPINIYIYPCMLCMLCILT
jgi:hypothetical protein